MIVRIRAQAAGRNHHDHAGAAIPVLVSARDRGHADYFEFLPVFDAGGLVSVMRSMTVVGSSSVRISER